MRTSGSRERAPRSISLAALAFVALGACSDGQKQPTEPAATPSPKVAETSPSIVLDTSDLRGMSDRQLLIAMLTKLNALEERAEQEVRLAQSRLDAAMVPGARLGMPSAPVAAVQKSANLSAQVSACAVNEFATEGKLEMSMSLYGGAEGHLGVDAYGNGGKAKVHGLAMGDVKFVPGGSAKLVVQVCIQGTGGITGTTPRLAAGEGLLGAAAIAPSGPAATLLTNLLSTVSADQVAGAVTRLGMDGTRLNSALTAVSNFSLSDLQFGKGAAGSLINALPLPVDVANLMRNPEDIFLKAPEGVQFAINKLCNQTFFTGEIAQHAMQACNLRNQLPDGQALVGILQGLNGLPTTLGALKSDLSGLCSTVIGMLPAKVSIPPWDVTLPLGIGTVRTFNGFSHDLFSNVPRPC